MSRKIYSNNSMAFAELAECILEGAAYKATKYLSDKLTIKATRKRYKGKILKGHAVEILFTIGKPNYEEREFIKKAKKAGEPFPIKKIQEKWNKPGGDEALKRRLVKAEAELVVIKAKRADAIRRAIN